MVRIKASDEEMVSALNALKERAELFDSRGNLLGYFMPADLAYSEARRMIEADYASGEYEKRKAESERGDWLTTEQVLAKLGSMETH